MATHKLIAVSLVIPFLAGCGGGGSNSVTAPAIPIPTVLTASAVASNGLTGTLTESAVVVPVGGSINYTLTLTNTTGQVVVIHTTKAHQENQPPVVDVTLQPGQAMTEIVPVAAFKVKGLYTAKASFVAGYGQTSIISADAGPLTVLAQ